MDFWQFKEQFQKEEVVELLNRVPKNPTVSVCVQTYQQKDYIEACLKGILMQETTFEFEILLGEDDSNDGTREICLRYAEKFPKKIRLFLHHRENQIKIMGEATAHFNALYNYFSARGEYIAFCEGDDFWTDPLKLQKQVDFLKKNKNYVFCYHEYESIDTSGKIIKDQIKQPKLEINPEELQKGIYHPLLLTLCFRKAVNELPKEIIEVFNLDSFFLCILGNYGSGKFLKEIAPAKYRRHSEGMWGKREKTKKFISKINTYEKLSRYYQRIGNTELSKWHCEKRKNFQKMLIVDLVKRGSLLAATQQLIELKR